MSNGHQSPEHTANGYQSPRSPRTKTIKVSHERYRELMQISQKERCTLIRALDMLIEQKSGKMNDSEYTNQREGLSTDDLIDLMKLQIAQTVQTGREHGFSMCGDEEIEIAERGTNNSIQLKKCPGLTLLFHTHPCQTPYPSEQDYRAAKGINTLQETCIGTKHGIYCYHPRNRDLKHVIHLEK